MLDFRGPVMGSLKSPYATSCRSIIQTTALNCLVFEKIAFLHFGIKIQDGAPKPILDVPNVTTHPSTASLPITVLLYNAPLLCGFNVPIKGLSQSTCM